MPVEIVKVIETEQLTFGDLFEAHFNGMAVRGRMSPDSAAQMAASLHLMNQALPLWIGDFMIAVEEQFGEESSQFLDAENGYAEKSVQNMRWVASRVPKENRSIPPLTWSHLQAVAALKLDQQRKWLDKAIDGDGDGPWPVSKLKTEIRKAGEGSGKLHWWLVVECGGEKKRDELAVEMEERGFAIAKREGLKTVQKKPRKKAKKAAVTAKRRRAPKRNQRRLKA